MENDMLYTTSEKGAIGEAAFSLWTAKKKYLAAKAPEKASYDYFLDKNDGSKILRVQVKYRTPNKQGQIELKLRPDLYNKNNHANYTDGCIDAFAIYNSNTEDIALVEMKDVPTEQGYMFFQCNEESKVSKIASRAAKSTCYIF